MCITLARCLPGETKFEASGMAFVNNTYHIVFDSHHSLGRIGAKLELLSPSNTFIGAKGGDSQFEGIAYKPKTGTFLVVKESHEHGGAIKPLIEELRLLPEDGSYEVVQQCVMDFDLSHENKGIEGMQYVDAGDSGQFLLALCEGNHCSGGRRGRDRGNGRILLAQLHSNASSTGKSDEGGHHNDTDCRWAIQKQLHIPASADFLDYSGMSYRGNTLGIISQEDSALWVGTFNSTTLEFEGQGHVYHFPRDNMCNQVYCNVEKAASPLGPPNSAASKSSCRESCPGAAPFLENPWRTRAPM
eukprot:jgi/Astpho2/8263/fgenesh1_pg.00122_%23_35_t